MKYKSISATVGLIGLGVLAGTIANQVNSYRETDGRWTEASAIIRVGDPVYLHTNSAHVSVGIESVEVAEDGHIIVNRELPARTKIATCIVDEDETLSRMGITAGCSGGSTVSNIYLYDRTGKVVRADDPRFSGSANLWVFWSGFIPAS